MLLQENNLQQEINIASGTVITTNQTRALRDRALKAARRAVELSLTCETGKSRLVQAKISKDTIKKAEKILADNNIEKDEVQTVLQAVGYALLDEELYLTGPDGLDV